MNKTKISEIRLVNKNVASLSCEVFDEVEMDLILQDEVGRARLQKHFSLKSGVNDLVLELPNLSAGQYNAWIDVSGETVIRQLEIDEEATGGGLLTKFKSWLNLFLTLPFTFPALLLINNVL